MTGQRSISLPQEIAKGTSHPFNKRWDEWPSDVSAHVPTDGPAECSALLRPRCTWSAVMMQFDPLRSPAGPCQEPRCHGSGVARPRSTSIGHLRIVGRHEMRENQRLDPGLLGDSSRVFCRCLVRRMLALATRHSARGHEPIDRGRVHRRVHQHVGPVRELHQIL